MRNLRTLKLYNQICWFGVWKNTDAITSFGDKGKNLINILEKYYTAYDNQADVGIMIFDEFDKICDIAHVRELIHWSWRGITKKATGKFRMTI